MFPIALKKGLTVSHDMLGCPGDELLGLLSDLTSKMRTGAITPKQVKRFLRREDPWSAGIKDVPEGDIRVGTYANGKVLLDSLRKLGRLKGRGAMLLASEEFPIEPEATISLVFPQAADLGFTERASLAEIYAKARSFDLEPCPLEAGPQLALQYRGYLFGSILFASSPVGVRMEMGDTECLFRLDGKGGELGLDIQPSCTMRSTWPSDHRFAFKKVS